jgi:hypothetical protein
VFRKTFLIIVLLVSFTAALLAQGGSLVVVQYYKQYEVAGKSYPVELVYTPNDGWIKLRIRFDNEKWSMDQALDFLKTEVWTITHAGRTEVGDQYFFTFTGKYPLWVPYRQFDERESFQYLRFTDAGKVVGKEITGSGLEKVVGDYYPYISK